MRLHLPKSIEILPLSKSATQDGIRWHPWMQCLPKTTADEYYVRFEMI